MSPSSDAQLCPVGLGCIGMSEFYGTPTEEKKGIETIQRAWSSSRRSRPWPRRRGAQLALAWVPARAPHIVATKFERVKKNLGALDVSLSPEDLRAIDAITPRGIAAGERYNEGGMATVNA